MYSVFHTEYTSIYRLFSLSLYYFISLTWYQSYCSDFLVFVVISSVLLLPLPSSNNHCQKQVTTVKPLQSSDPVCSLIKLLNHDHKLIDQTIPSKTQPKTSWSEFVTLQHAPPEVSAKSNTCLMRHHAPPVPLTCLHTLVLHRHALHALPRAPRA